MKFSLTTQTFSSFISDVSGVRLNSLLGRKGSLEKMNNYWDVGQFFTVSMLANDVPKATQAAEKLFKLKPPLW